MKSIDEEMAEVIGAMAGDGHIAVYNSKDYKVEITGHRIHDLSYLVYLNSMLQHHIDCLKPHYYTVDNTVRLVYYSKELFVFFKHNVGFPVGVKGDRIHIPSTIKNDDMLMRSFIRGLFDTDGCVFFDKRSIYRKPYPRLYFTTISQKLFKEVQDYLEMHFKMRIAIRARHNRSLAYSFEIYGHDQLNKWLELIGFSNDKHLKKLPL